MKPDSMSSYLKEIGRYPLLNKAQEFELGYRIQAYLSLRDVPEAARTPDQKKIVRVGIKARRDLINSNLRLVVSIAKRWQGNNIELIDLVQEGSIGLSRAAEKYDPNKGYKFSTYAPWWIRQAITRVVYQHKSIIRTPIHVGEDLAKIRKAVEAFQRKENRYPTIEEISKACEMKEEKVVKLLQVAKPVKSLNEPMSHDDDSLALIDILSRAEDTLDPVYSQSESELATLIQQADLNDRQIEVLKYRFGLEELKDNPVKEPKNAQPSHQRIADYFGNLSKESIRKQERVALRKLRNAAMARRAS